MTDPRTERPVIAVDDEAAGPQDDPPPSEETAKLMRLHEFALRLTAGLEVRPIFEHLLRAAMELLGTDRGSFQLHDPAHHELVLEGYAGFDPAFGDFFARLPAGRGSCGAAMKLGTRVIVEDTETESSWAELREAARRHRFRAVQSTPIFSRGGALIGMVSTHFERPHRPADRDLRLLDLYVRHAADAIENARLYEAVRESARRKDEFLAMLGHELRNPLSAAHAALATAQRDEGSRMRALSIAQRATEQLGRLVDDLLDVARISQGRIVLRKEPADLAGIVERAVESVQNQIEARGHALHVATPPGEVRLEGDVVRLQQVVVNLLTNAARYTAPGGRLSLVAAREGGEAVVRVRDSGVGIAPDMLARVFELFAQAEQGPDRAQGGLGVGLTIVRQIVELHGGRVEACSEGLGRGAEFVVRLPALPAAPEPRPAAAPTGARRPGARVLLVEDNPDVAEASSMLLEMLGHQVRVASEGLAALDCVRADPPDVMLIDIGLPDVDGYEVARRVRQDPRLGRVVLVALTGYGRDEDKQRAAAAGFDHHLVKPIQIEVLESLVG